MNPLVTVYITNYNYGRFIRQSIESVLNQSLKNVELLIIDDGSTDNSHTVIEEYAGRPGIHVIYQQNKGLNVTNNIALRAAHGKYLVRLDADDFFEPDALEALCAPLEADDALGLVFPDYFLVDEGGHKTGEVVRHNFASEVSLLDQPAHGACTVIRRSFLLELGGYNEDYTCQDGYELWIKFIAHYKVMNVNRPLFHYRQHGKNLTTNEDRILQTRQRIKENFVSIKGLTLPRTVAVLPVRSQYIGKENLPLAQLGGNTLLGRLASEAARANSIRYVVITSADAEIEQYVHTNLSHLPKVIFLSRPAAYARMNQSLAATYQLVLDSLPADAKPEALLNLSIEFPFVKAETLDDAVRTLTIFGADSLVSVRPDNSTYFRHTGTGMEPILHQDKFTKLEREVLYKGTGGIAIGTVNIFQQQKRLIAGKVTHIVLDQLSSHGIGSAFDLQLARFLAENTR